MEQKQIIVISDVVSKLPNVITVSFDQFVTNIYKNAYVLIDRSAVTSKQIIEIKKHCHNSGLNPFIDGSYMDVSYIFIPDFQAENDDEVYCKPILAAIDTLREAEKSRLKYEISDLEMKLDRINPWIDHPFVKRLFALNVQLQSI